MASHLTMRYHRPKWMQPATTESPTVLLLSIFAVLYFSTILYLQHTAWRDPTSKFFQPRQAYAPRYSELRSHQAEEFILDTASAPPIPRTGRNASHATPEICVGIPTVARAGVRYMRTAIGSLMDGLTEHERDRMHLILFFADVDPSSHPAYHEPWITGLADQVLVYELPKNEIERVGSLEGRQKGMFDYRYLLNACYATGAPYVTLIEDDVLAMDGWYERTMDALEDVQEKTAQEGSSKDWLYLRLFYTEEFLGWNSEHVQERILWSVALIAAAVTTLLCTRAFSPRIGKHLPNSLILAVCGFCLPLCIMLFFFAGRVTLFPYSHGVSKMEKYGCCSQGLVFNRDETPELLDWLETAPSGLFFDMQVEKYADEHAGLSRWAVHPPVLQHMGMKSSSREELKAEVAESIWSFEFEMYDAEKLRKERKLTSNKEDLMT